MSLTNSLTDITKIVRGLIKDQSRSDGRDTFEFKSDNKFTLSEPFIDETSIVVFQNGTAIASQDFSYNSSTNQVTITFVTTGGALTINDIIVITYDYFKKFSNAEIDDFIADSLSYFAQYRYRKIFEINKDNEVVAINDLDPEPKEIYFIAIIASILIDPQNIEVRVGADFQLTANRNNSDQEQISLAFAQFRRFVGDVNFESDDFRFHDRRIK